MKEKRELTEQQKTIQRRIISLISDYCDGVQQNFANKVGINKSSVSQYVNGTNFPDNKRAELIGKTFGVNPVWVLGYDVPMSPMDTASAAEKHFTILEKFLKLTPRDQQIVENMIDSMLGKTS